MLPQSIVVNETLSVDESGAWLDPELRSELLGILGLLPNRLATVERWQRTLKLLGAVAVALGSQDNDAVRRATEDLTLGMPDRSTRFGEGAYERAPEEVQEWLVRLKHTVSLSTGRQAGSPMGRTLGSAVEDDRLLDEELVIHAFALLEGPDRVRARAEFTELWSRSRSLLDLTEPITRAGLAAELPADLNGEKFAALAATENRAGDVQLIARRWDDVLHLSLLFAAPRQAISVRERTVTRWIEFDRRWREITAGGTGSLLGITRVFQAKLRNVNQIALSADGPPPTARTALPTMGSGSLGWGVGHVPADGLVLWEPRIYPPADPERVIVVLAAPDDDAQLSAWTWIASGQTSPPLARYLLHAAKLRYQMRVWSKDRNPIVAESNRIERLVEQGRSDPARLGEDEWSALESADLGSCVSDLHELHRTVEAIDANMRSSLAGLLSQDRNQADRLIQDVDSTAKKLERIRNDAAELRRIDWPSPAAADPEDDSDIILRLGFALDIIGYSRRTSPLKKEAQSRLDAIVDGMVEDARVQVFKSQPTGDGVNVFLHEKTVIHTALRVLVRSCCDRLARDNEQHADRIRLRFASVVGPTGLAQFGFSGHAIVELNRLLESKVLRRAAELHPDADMVALISEQLYSYLFVEGYVNLDEGPLEKVTVRDKAKNFSAQARLWVEV
jgi:hypothetical protein